MINTTKRGQLDNIATYEHICDTRADMANIPSNQINLGSVCIVLKGEAGLEVYMATSQKEWIDVAPVASVNTNDANSDIVDIDTADNMTLQE